MKKVIPHSFVDGQWRPVEVLAPVMHIHREDPIPYAMPTSRPWNVPLACQIPTYEGSGMTTHPSVVDFQMEDVPGGKFQGYRYWMCHTPYPNAEVIYENPSIVASNNGWDWHDPYGITNPVVPEPLPGDGYNADGDLVWNPDEGRLELIWKWRNLQDSTDVFWRHSFSYDGVIWSEGTRIDPAPGSTTPGPGYASAGMARVGPDDWRIVLLTPSRGLATWSAKTPAGPWEGPVVGNITGLSLIEGENLWHPDVAYHEGSWWMVCSTNGTRTSVHPARSADGVDWVFGPPILNDEEGDPTNDRYKYRTALVPHDNGTHMRIWYANMGPKHIRYTIIPLSEWPTI